MKNNYKKLFLVLTLTIYYSLSFGQNGTYTCNRQSFSKGDNDKFYTDKMIIIIDVSTITGGTVSINNITQDFNFKYEITSKVIVDTDKKLRIITKAYDAKMNMNNVQVGDTVLIGIQEHMDNENLNFWVYSKGTDSYNRYFNLIKMK